MMVCSHAHANFSDQLQLRRVAGAQKATLHAAARATLLQSGSALAQNAASAAALIDSCTHATTNASQNAHG